MRILFAGSPELAVPSLRLLAERHEVCGALVQPDKPSGRGCRVQPVPVKTAARELNITVLEPRGLSASFLQEVASLEAQLLVVVAYGKIFPKAMIDLFPLGGINMHPSLLPHLRGPSPLAAAILNGEAKTGITIQRLALEMDRGEILVQEEIPLVGDETTASLSSVVAQRSPALLDEVLKRLEKNPSLQGKKQRESEATYCRLLTKRDGLLDWKRRGCELERQVRACHPWPGSYTFWRGEPLRILEMSLLEEGPTQEARPGEVIGLDSQNGILVQTGEGVALLQKLQRPGRPVRSFEAFWRGSPDFCHTQLGAES